MEFTEALKQVFENPGMEFQRNNVIMKVENEMLTFRNQIGVIVEIQQVSRYDYKSDWQPVPREVTWQEAIQAWIDGKSIKQVNDNDSDLFMGWATDGKNNVLCSLHRDRLKQGHWYIVG